MRYLEAFATMIAYVLVKCRPGRDSGVAQETVKIDGVMEAAWTYGFCDILLKLNIGSVEKLNDIVFNKIRKMHGVESTETLMVSPIPIYGRRPSRTPSRARSKKNKGSKR